MSCPVQQDIMELQQASVCFRKESAARKSSFTVPNPSRLFTAAHKIVFHLNKAALRIRQNIAIRGIQYHDNEEDEDSFDRSHDLSLHLSSVESPCGKANSSFTTSPASSRHLLSSTNISDLPSSAIKRIAQLLDTKSVRNFAQTCSKVRTSVLSQSHKMEKHVVTKYEIIIAYNTEKGAVDVRALKRNRSIRDEVFSAASILDVLPKLVHCMAKVTFGNGVNVYDYRKILLQLHYRNELTPLALYFTGGSFSKGNVACCGADLRLFTETEFIKFIGHFYPHIQELQLLTTRLFKTTSSPPRLLSFLPLLNSFGISFERPAVKYYFEDVRQIVSYWRHDPLSRSSTVYMRSPSGSCMLKWMDVGGTVKGCTTGAHRVVIPHMFQSGIYLTFHLH